MRDRNGLRSCLIAACAAASCCPGIEAARADGQHADRIEVIGTYENAVGTSDAASQGYVTPRQIEAKPLLRPAEVLEAVPGVIVTQHSGDGKANQFFLRGFNLDHGTDFLTTVAGVPVNMPTHAHGQGYSDLNFLIPELIQRVDYRKGPYFATEGDFSSAGSAHFHYQEKLKADIAQLTAGGFHYDRALLAGSPQLGAGTLLYALEIAGYDGPWVNPARFGKQNAVLRYGFGGNGDSHLVTAMAYQGRWNATDQIPLRSVSGGLLDRYGAVDPTDGGDSQRYSLSYERRHTHRDGEFHLAVYALRYRLRLFSNFTYFLNDPANGDQFEQLDRRGVFGVAPTWLWTGRMGERESIVKAGLHLRRDDIGTVGLQNTAARERLATVRDDSVRQTGFGAYVEHSLAWTDWLRSVAGLRTDYYFARVNSNLAANSGRTADRITSPKLNLVLGPFASTEYFLSIGSGFHSNDARGTTTRVDPATGAAAVPVPALVRTRGAEIGARTEWLPGWQSSVALWRLALDSELLFVGDAGNTTAARPSMRRGIEWSNRYRPRPWLVIDADLSASSARFTEFDPAGNRIPGAVDRVLALGASIENSGPWSGALQLRYFGPRPLVEDDSVRSQSTLLWNMRIGYKLERGVRLTLDMLNLFDRKASDIDYFYASRLRGEPAAVNDIHFHPVEPRTLRLTLSANF